MARAKGRFVHENGRFGGWQGEKDSSSTKKAVLVDGKGKRAVRPRKWPIWWMARAKGRDGAAWATCHPRLGGACEAKTVCGRAGGGRRCRPGPPETRPQAWMADGRKRRGGRGGAAKQKKRPTRKSQPHGVEVVGFEPATPCLQSMCSTS